MPGHCQRRRRQRSVLTAAVAVLVLMLGVAACGAFGAASTAIEATSTDATAESSHVERDGEGPGDSGTNANGDGEGGASSCTPACSAWAACENGACVDVAPQLAPLRHEILCLNDATPCAIATATPPNKQVALAGTVGRTYALTLRIRGVVEQKAYTNANPGLAKGINAVFFISGGTTEPSDTWNLYELIISAPASIWHFNSGVSGNTFSSLIDYTAVIEASAGATLVVHANSYDQGQARNIDQAGNPIVIPNVAPAPQAFRGQFVQLDVVSVAMIP